MLSKVIKDSKDNAFKENVINGLEEAYIAGFDLAIQLCKDDNSNAGHAMAEHLEFLNEDGTIKYD